jgi:hypothetical protein
MKVLRILSLVVVILGVASPEARAASTTITVLHEADLAAEERGLIEALRIYTRDLDCQVLVRGDAPTVITPETLEQLERGAKETGASIVVWTHRRDDGQTLFYIFDVASHDLRETEVPAGGVDGAAMEVALKARALLVVVDRRPAPTSSHAPGGTSDAEATPSTPTVPPPESAAPPGGARAPSASPPPHAAPSAPESGAPTVEAHRSPEPAAVVPRYALGATFGVVSPLDTTWLRSGLVVSAALRFGRLGSGRLWLTLDAAFTNQPHAQVNGFEVTLRDVPLAAGALARWSSSRAGFAAGPRASVHALEVDASGADGRTGASRRYTVGLGGFARGELRLINRVSGTLGLSIEGLVPTQEFTIAGQRVLTTGSVLLGATAGVVVLLP